MKINKVYTKSIERIMSSLSLDFIHNGITLPEILKILKKSMVLTAEKINKSNVKLTESRISLLTGVHRKDVKRIRNLDYFETESTSVYARVISEWTANPKYLNEKGYPAKLPKFGICSFDDLVSSVSKDIRSRTLLDDWKERKIITLDKKDLIKLNLKNYSPSDSDLEMRYFFGENIADHIYASSQNFIDKQNRNFERAVYSSGLTKDSIKKIEDLAIELSMPVLVKINKLAFDLAQNDKKKKEQKYRFKLGSYFLKIETETKNTSVNKNT